MGRFQKIVSRLIGFTRREKRATLVTASILLVVIIIRYSLVFYKPDTVVVTPLEERNQISEVVTNQVTKPVLFRFDPNTATKEMLLALGLSGQQASTLINYRKAGARFDEPSDLLRVYGVDSLLVSRLTPYILISNTAEYKKSGEGSVVSEVSSEQVNKNHTYTLTDLNTCSSAELQALPGIGEVLSERIIKYRKQLGGFITVKQLEEVYGIDTSYLERIYEMVYVNIDSVKRIRMDSCSFRELAKHPYIGYEAALSIVKFRELMGSPESINELIKQKVIDSTSAYRMGPYCLFVTTK